MQLFYGLFAIFQSFWSTKGLRQPKVKIQIILNFCKLRCKSIRNVFVSLENLWTVAWRLQGDLGRAEGKVKVIWELYIYATYISLKLTMWYRLVYEYKAGLSACNNEVIEQFRLVWLIMHVSSWKNIAQIYFCITLWLVLISNHLK